MKKILFVYGTRPEAIKMAPLIKRFQSSNKFNSKICVTAQHRGMMDLVNNFFDITPDFDLDLMKAGQDLFSLTTDIVNHIKPVLEEFEPDLVFVQGDTTSVLAVSIACFYKKIKVAHLEAGLRSGSPLDPFPEEMNRRLTSEIASMHFAPTILASENLKEENIVNHVHVVGNTVVDALMLGLKTIENQGDVEFFDNFKFLDFEKKILLVTFHRRESFGESLLNICSAIRKIAEAHSELQIVFPVHPNPNVKVPVFENLSNISNVFLIEPLEYPKLIWIMNKSYFIVTDSGGIQEEAPTLGKPVLVLRNVTERQEGVDAGVAQLVGTNPALIISAASLLLNDVKHYNKIANTINPYGTGESCNLIYDIVVDFFENEKE